MVRDVVGLYLNPPERAVVLCVDEKSQIQALDRTAPILPMLPGVPERATHDYTRSGTSSLYAALRRPVAQNDRARRADRRQPRRSNIEGFPPYRAAGLSGNLGAMTHRIHRTTPITGHVHVVPVVRELPHPPTAVSTSSTW